MTSLKKNRCKNILFISIFLNIHNKNKQWQIFLDRKLAHPAATTMFNNLPILQLLILLTWVSIHKVGYTAGVSSKLRHTTVEYEWVGGPSVMTST